MNKVQEFLQERGLTKRASYNQIRKVASLKKEALRGAKGFIAGLKPKAHRFMQLTAPTGNKLLRDYSNILQMKRLTGGAESVFNSTASAGLGHRADKVLNELSSPIMESRRYPRIYSAIKNDPGLKRMQERLIGRRYSVIGDGQYQVGSAVDERRWLQRRIKQLQNYGFSRQEIIQNLKSK